MCHKVIGLFVEFPCCQLFLKIDCMLRCSVDILKCFLFSRYFPVFYGNQSNSLVLQRSKVTI